MTPITSDQAEARYPRLLRMMRWAAILSHGEAAGTLRDWRNGYRIGGGEAVWHFGGPEAVIRAGIRARHHIPR